MSIEERNVAILKQGYDLWRATKGGSSDHWLSLMAEDVKFRSLAQGRERAVAFTKPRQGRADVEKYLHELTDGWAMIDYVVDHFVAQDDRVVVIGRTSWRNRTTEKTVDTPKVDAWRFSSEGKAIEFYEYYDTAALFAAAV